MQKVVGFVFAAVTVAVLSAIPASAQNVLQAEIPGGVTCPRFVEEFIPGLDLTLTTSGRPVEVSYVIGFSSSPQGIIHLIPVINGIKLVDDQLDRAIGDFLGSGQRDTVSFSKVYWLPRDTHTFALIFTCQSAIDLVRGWLTVNELPKQGQRGQSE